ncbi:chymotrypsin-1-like [Bicyclus anynana]|uniref:Chymotrypsin-1-like n=1 Tax=Bicyclus anynana TaxID=110368 RepID=A0ABM3LTD0_BICAN|nr:chymotrypsin-1-like [Bicyclus anynana]
MKVLVILVSFAALISAGTVPESARFNPVYDYMARIGIPEAERIRKAEEAALSSRIVGGNKAAHGQLPYQVGLISDIIGTTSRGICGGSLITENRVVTAAHCWFDGRNHGWRFTVVLGSVYLFSGGHRVLTSIVTTHPDWIPWLIRNDIMIVHLLVRVTLSRKLKKYSECLLRTLCTPLPTRQTIITIANMFTATISTIQLPTGRLLYENFAGYQATASGYGLTESGGNISAEQFLSYVQVNVIGNNVCGAAYPTIIQDAHICTSTLGNVGPLQGDSGGPLVVQTGGRIVLVGATSFGSALSLNLPTVYSRITYYIDFIKANL